VKEPPSDLGLFEGIVPRLPEINHRLTGSVENVLAHLRRAILLLDGAGRSAAFYQSPQVEI
jgi:hypothetical protein